MDKIIRIEGNILLVNRKSFFNIHLTIQSDFSNISLSNSHFEMTTFIVLVFVLLNKNVAISISKSWDFEIRY
jgi:hypothetical protein